MEVNKAIKRIASMVGQTVKVTYADQTIDIGMFDSYCFEGNFKMIVLNIKSKYKVINFEQVVTMEEQGERIVGERI